MLIIHKYCGTPVVLDLSKTTKFVFTFSVGETGLVCSQGDLLFEGEVGKTEFYCTTCKENINDLEGKCVRCGEMYSISNLHKSLESGGTFCEKCVEFLNINTRELSEIINHVIIM